MRYVMRQKLFSWADDYVVKNQSGEDAFIVDGKAFALGSQLSFQDLHGNEFAFIKQKLLSWGPTYEIFKDDRHYATIQKELFTFFKCSFTVHLDDQPDLDAEGDLTDHEYEITRGGQPVAAISKQWFEWADTYGVDIADGEDPVLILASTVAIDLACHGDRN